MNIPGNSGPPPCHFLFANAVYLPLMPPLDQTCGARKSEALSQAVRRGRRGGAWRRRRPVLGIGSRREKVRVKRSQGRRIISATAHSAGLTPFLPPQRRNPAWRRGFLHSPLCNELH